jgi:hypothetical protein
MYTPASSTTGSVLDDPPKTVLAIFFYHFTTFLGDDATRARGFTMKDHPVTWPNIADLNNNDWSGGIRLSINAIARQYNAAAQLLLVIFWSYILKDDSDEETMNSTFWTFAREYAVNILFKF